MMDFKEIDKKIENFLKKIIFLKNSVIEEIKEKSLVEKEQILPFLENIYEKEQVLLEKIFKKNPGILRDFDRSVIREKILEMKKREHFENEQSLSEIEDLILEL